MPLRHIMLSYQWDDQELVKRVNCQLNNMGFTTWMDVDAMTGDLNTAMAKAVENAVCLVPFMTQKYQDSKNCKKELSYGEQCDKAIVPCMVQKNYRSSGWLGLITAGLLWIDFRNTSNFDKSIESLIKEITATCSDLMAKAAVNVSSEEAKQLIVPQKGRAFIHILTHKYLAESGEVKFDQDSGDSRSSLTTSDGPEDTSFWIQEKGKGGKVYFRNYHTNGYLGYDPNGDYIYTKASKSFAEEWKIITFCGDDTGRRAVLIYANYGKKYLTVRNVPQLDISPNGIISETEKLAAVKDACKECIWYLH